MRSLACGGALILAIFIISGFFGRYFGLGDSAAVGRLQAAALLTPLAVLLCFLSAWRIGIVLIALVISAFASVAPAFLQSEQDCEKSCLTVYQKNLLSKAWPRYPLADDIILSGAEVVTPERPLENP